MFKHSLIAGLLVCFCLTLVAADSNKAAKTVPPIDILRIEDAPATMRSDIFQGGNKEEMEKITLMGTTPSAINVYLYKMTDGGYVLFDAGIGSDNGGKLMDKLAELQLAPEDISAILLTHMHSDHIGGLLNPEGKANFVNATIYVSHVDWEYYYNDPGTMAKPVNPKTIFQAYNGRIMAFLPNAAILPGVKAYDASGHSPGHVIYETPGAWIIGDLVHAVSWQIDDPDLYPSYDMDPEMAVGRRKDFFEIIQESGKPAAGMHIGGSGIIKITKATRDKFSYTEVKPEIK